MTEPLHAYDKRTHDGARSLGRYYHACSETCPFGDLDAISVTNAQSVVSKPALVPAAVKVTAETAWAQLPRMVSTSRQPEEGKPTDGGKPCKGRRVAERCGGCRFCVTAAIKAEHRNQWDDAADFGSLIHHLAHQHNIGEPYRFEPEAEPYLQQYLRFLERHHVDWDRDIEASETTILDRAHGYAGTGDLWLQLRTGRGGARQLWLIDIKTSRKAPVDRVYPDQELQLAGLRYAKTAVLVNDTETEVPDFAGAAILNLRAREHQLIPLPADRNAHAAFLGAVTLQRHFHAQETKAWKAIDPPPAPADRTPTTTTTGA